MSRGNHSKPQGVGQWSCAHKEPEVMQQSGQKGHTGKEALGVTGVPQVSPPQLAEPCWREPLSRVQQTRKTHHPWIAAVLESKSQSLVCLPRALFWLLSERYSLLCRGVEHWAEKLHWEWAQI